MTVRASVAATLVLLIARPVLACSLVWANFGQAQLPPHGARVGPMPLLTAPTTVLDSAGNRIDVLVTNGTPLDGARDEWDEPVVLSTPVTPLAPGSYTKSFDDGSAAVGFLVVDATEVDTAPTVSNAELLLTLREPVDTGGCPGSSSSCDGVAITKLEIGISMDGGVDPMEVSFLVELSSDLGAASYLVRAGSAWGDTSWDGVIGFHHNIEGLGRLTRDRTCVRLTPLAPDGSLGAAFGAGCVDPNDPDDPRVDDYQNDGGCSASDQDPAWLAVAVLLLRLRSRARRRP